jgi:hypothetical protein
VPSEGGNEEVGVAVDDPDQQKAAEAQLGKNPDEAVRAHKSPEASQSSLPSNSGTSKPGVGGEEIHPASSSQSHQQQDNKKPSPPTGHDEPFELWEREIMEEMLTDIRGHLGRHLAIPMFASG